MTKGPKGGKAGARIQMSGQLTDHDIYLFKEGKHAKLYDRLGARLMSRDGESGTAFAVWAPNAESVSVVGEFNDWDPSANRLNVRRDESGIWEGFVPGVGQGSVYKYHIVSRDNGYTVDKADPFAFHAETPPRTGSIVWNLEYKWEDEEWMKNRFMVNSLDAPISIYEVHVGSWRRVPEDGNRSLTYRETADHLCDYVREMGFTHVEFLPVMEHPFYGSWGYQVSGYFAPTSRYGTPQDFMYLVDRLHQAGIGVILDWVPSHFPGDEHGLVYFDGTHLYEHMDPRQGFHPDWKSYIFNYSRHEVCAFLLSSALFWLDYYHMDGLRVDAVASMLYLDYSRQQGEWVPNKYGTNENLDAIEFLKTFNTLVYKEHPDIQTYAEESTSWPMVSKPIYVGGLGFGTKWNMGWMHDTLQYFARDPLFRKYYHNQLAFSISYAFFENFVLSISHDEVTHGKGSLYGKMPGNEWEKLANVRLLLGYMYAHPGKKLLFMGSEFGQWREWLHEESVEWHALEHPHHAGVQRWVRDLNTLYRGEPALFSLDFSSEGFEWVDVHDWEGSTLSFMRRGSRSDDIVLVLCNMTPVPRSNYRIGVPRGGHWQEILNSDASIYGGANHGNTGGVNASPIARHGHFHSLSVTLPPLGIVFFKSTGTGA
ncbi:MAG: 1,4-alpha-glucan branching protein GlgB [Bacteroidota bacterium]